MTESAYDFSRALEELQKRYPIWPDPQVDLESIYGTAIRVLQGRPCLGTDERDLYVDDQTDLLQEIDRTEIMTNRSNFAVEHSEWKKDGEDSLSYRAAVISERAKLPLKFENLPDLIASVMESAKQP